MQLSSTFSFLDSLRNSSLLQLFVLSTVILVVGVTLEIYVRVFKLKFLDNEPLNRIEGRHPFIPSLQTILIVLFSYLCIITPALLILTDQLPFSGPYRSLAVLSIIFLAITASIVSCIQYRNASRISLLVTLFLSLLLMAVLLSSYLSTRLDMFKGVLFVLLLILSASLGLTEILRLARRHSDQSH